METSYPYRGQVMAAKAVGTHGQLTCVVEVSPGEVDAGAELTVTVRVACPHGCDLRGQIVSITKELELERKTSLAMFGRAPGPFILPRSKRKPRSRLETISGRSRLPDRAWAYRMRPAYSPSPSRSSALPIMR